MKAPETKIIYREGSSYDREANLDGFDACFTLRLETPPGLDMSCPCSHRYRYYTTIYDATTMKPLYTTEVADATPPRLDYEYTFIDVPCTLDSTFSFQPGVAYKAYTYLCVEQGTLNRDDCSPVAITDYTHAVRLPPPPPIATSSSR